MRRSLHYNWVRELWSDPAEDEKLPKLDELSKRKEHRRLNEPIRKRMKAQPVVQDDILAKLYLYREGRTTNVKYSQALLEEKEGER